MVRPTTGPYESCAVLVLWLWWSWMSVESSGCLMLLYGALRGSHMTPFTASIADGSGSVWLFAGTDSGFEATTNVYFTWFVATFEP